MNIFGEKCNSSNARECNSTENNVCECRNYFQCLTGKNEELINLFENFSEKFNQKSLLGGELEKENKINTNLNDELKTNLVKEINANLVSEINTNLVNKINTSLVEEINNIVTTDLKRVFLDELKQVVRDELIQKNELESLFTNKIQDILAGQVKNVFISRFEDILDTEVRNLLENNLKNFYVQFKQILVSLGDELHSFSNELVLSRNTANEKMEKLTKLILNFGKEITPLYYFMKYRGKLSEKEINEKINSRINSLKAEFL